MEEGKPSSTVADLIQAHGNKYFISKRADEKIPVLALSPSPNIDPNVHLSKETLLFFLFFICLFTSTSRNSFRNVFHIVICQLCLCSSVGRA